MSHPIDRRSLMSGALALTGALAAPAARAATATTSWPKGFFWGASTAAHQVEGNNTNADLWVMEQVKNGAFAQPSGDACNSLEMWATDLDLVKSLGLNTYRFSIEWARIEPVKGQFSQAMLDHYKAMVDGCRARGLNAIVTFNHFTAPVWFSAQGGWTNPEAPTLFARYCERVARHMGNGMAAAITMNEPNILTLLSTFLPPPVWEIQKRTAIEAGKMVGSARFVAANVAALEDVPAIEAGLAAGHVAARAAIKAACPKLPVGLSLSMFDDQAAGAHSMRDAMRAKLYGRFLELARKDDFLGVQNYERAVWNDKGRLPPPDNAIRNSSGAEVYAPSLAGSVRYAHAATGVPILVSEHGVGTDDDAVRARFIAEALPLLKQVIDDGVPVLGYCHWSLIDNFEWIFGYRPKYGLCSMDPVTFARHPKPSALSYGAYAKEAAKA